MSCWDLSCREFLLQSPGISGTSRDASLASVILSSMSLGLLAQSRNVAEVTLPRACGGERSPMRSGVLSILKDA